MGKQNTNSLRGPGSYETETSSLMRAGTAFGKSQRKFYLNEEIELIDHVTKSLSKINKQIVPSSYNKHHR